jgi:hypothetical protein
VCIQKLSHDSHDERPIMDRMERVKTYHLEYFKFMSNVLEEIVWGCVVVL